MAQGGQGKARGGDVMAKEEKKICPLAFTQEHSDFNYCVKEQCAWWNDKYKMCATRLIAEMSTMEIKDA